MKTRTTRRLLTALLAAAASLPATAHAGQYDINACAVPGRESTSQGVWVAYQVGDPAYLQMPTTTCAGSGHFGRTDVGSAFDTYRFMSGAAGFKAEVPLGQNIEIRRVTLRGEVSYAKPSDSVGALHTTATPGEFAICGATQACDSTWTLNFPAKTSDVTIGVTCFTGGNCKSGKTYRQEWKWAVLTAEESGKPVLASVGGALVSGEPQRMVRQLTYVATDGESGVARVQVRLGGVLVGDDDAREDVARCHHHGWAACPATANGSVEIDTRQASEGEQPLTLTITDAAGNTTEAAAGTVLIDNVRPPVVAQAPGVAGTAMAGEVLTGTLGRFTGATAAAPAVRWKRCDAGGCAAIPGATDATYRLTAEDVGKQVLFAVTAVNGADEPATAESARTATVVARPEQPAGGGGTGT
ncbi:MAG TPA: hypothetical protein VN238_04340, partial [Solirubrobacteraceae bacterium]|nr:hypothetical protein [Solirubrobacteraceae bacterium]